MFNISSLLQKISKNVFSTEESQKIIVHTLSKKIGIDIVPEAIEIKNNVVYTTLSPGIKNKIFIYKQEILLEINKNTSLVIVDIK